MLRVCNRFWFRYRSANMLNTVPFLSAAHGSRRGWGGGQREHSAHFNAKRKTFFSSAAAPHLLDWPTRSHCAHISFGTNKLHGFIVEIGKSSIRSTNHWIRIKLMDSIINKCVTVCAHKQTQMGKNCKLYTQTNSKVISSELTPMSWNRRISTAHNWFNAIFCCCRQFAICCSARVCVT